MKEIIYFALAGIAVCGLPVLVNRYKTLYCNCCGMPVKHCLCRVVDSTYAPIEDEDRPAA